MTRRLIGPFSRVEGDLEVKIDVENNQIANAWVTSPLYRGFEKMLVDKDPRDALVYAPRICGICSVSQSVAAAHALRKAQNLKLPKNAELLSNIVLAIENIADHLTHFYLFFMPDFAREAYAKESWFTEVEQRFKAINGIASQEFLPVRTQFLHLMGMLVGKWPHSLAIQAGGVTHAINTNDKQKLLALVFGLRQFLENRLFGITLEQFVSFSNDTELQTYVEANTPNSADFRHFLWIAETLALHGLGRATDKFMSYGAYELEDNHQFKQGVWHNGIQSLNIAAIREDVTHAWFEDQQTARHPSEGITQPNIDNDDAYSWCKAPRLDGQVVEVGALARQLVDGHPLISELVQLNGGNVKNRVVARLLEVSRLLPLLEEWIKAINPEESFYVEAEIPQNAQGVGMIEAARGSLGHWLDIRDGKIFNYQIVAPTTWNFSPRDQQQQAGALEQALIGTPVSDSEKNPISVQHIVRSFDPCMVCTVH